EYRGYDSAGIAVCHRSLGVQTVKSPGRIEALEARLADAPLEGTVGIGHTRWATHGPPTETNAHPHPGGEGEIVLVHNGVIENYVALKQQLQQRGFVFISATDTEVVAHLIAYHLRRTLAADDGEDRYA